MDIRPLRRETFQRLYTLVAVSVVGSALGGCAVLRSTDGYRWIINQNESGLRLVHGLPESDDIDYTFLCESNRLHLWYSDGAEDEPYGTVHKTVVEISVGNKKRMVPAQAEFNEGGSPDVDAIIADPASMLRDMARAGEISTKDKWGEYSAPAPSPGIIRRFAARCAIPMK